MPASRSRRKGSAARLAGCARALCLTFPLAFSLGAQATESGHTGSIARPIPASALAASSAEALKAAIEAYRKGDLEGGDRLAAALSEPMARSLAEWAALRHAPRNLGFQRINAFMAANPDWPGRNFVRRKAEDALFLERAGAARVLTFFADDAPLGPPGRAILAQALLSDGRIARAHVLAREAYLDRQANRDVASFIEKHFPNLITPEVKEIRAHRLINAGRAEGLRLASELGPDRFKLAQALAHAENDGRSSAPLDAVPQQLRDHPSYRMAAAEILRRQDKWQAGRDMLLAIPAEDIRVPDGDALWQTRRTMARRLLNMKDFDGAYRVVAAHAGASQGHRAEAEFHAGWIALRYLNQTETAARHFEMSGWLARSPLARSRAAYWSGRAADAAGQDAKPHFERAAQLPHTFYGQLASEQLGRAKLDLGPLSADPSEMTDAAGRQPLRVIQALIDIGQSDLAMPLAAELTRSTQRDDDIAAVIALFERTQDAGAVVSLGKLALERDRPFLEAAFPTFGIPAFERIPGSADAEIVYAIARQESAFRARAVSHANARGLMQMLPSTAARTAKRFNVAFDAGKLTSDPAFNARLGAAHVGELLEEMRGSLVMSIAAYNAGGHRVKEWVEQFGDPRDAGVDVVDWIERIPFYETRHYVQKVLENLQVYRARFGGETAVLRLSADLASGRRAPPDRVLLADER